MSRRRVVAFGLLGVVVDRGKSAARRWDGWRPTVAACQHDDLLIDRFELLYPERHRELAETVRDDIGQVSPETEVRLAVDPTVDSWDFEDVYGSLHDFARAYPFDTDAEDYLVHITTGSHVAQICLFLLTESRHIPGRLLQTNPFHGGRSAAPGSYRVIDLDLSKYDRLASRFKDESLVPEMPPAKLVPTG